MFGFARILSVLVALALGLSPLAPVAAQCADQTARSEMAAMQDMSCCPADDEPAEPLVCKTGCIQMGVENSVSDRSTGVPAAGYLLAQPALQTEWQAPPDFDPPKSHLLS